MKTPLFAAIAASTLMLAGAAPAAKLKTAVFAGGCFWSIEKAMEKAPGVTAAVSGYSGGATTKPTYEDHEGHLEAVRSWASVSRQVWAPPPLAITYWNEGSTVSVRFSPRFQLDRPRMLPVSDGLMRYSKKPLEQGKPAELSTWAPGPGVGRSQTLEFTGTARLLNCVRLRRPLKWLRFSL